MKVFLILMLFIQFSFAQTENIGKSKIQLLDPRPSSKRHYEGDLECLSGTGKLSYLNSEENCNKCCEKVDSLYPEDILIAYVEFRKDPNNSYGDCYCSKNSSTKNENVSDKQLEQDTTNILKPESHNFYSINKKDCSNEINKRPGKNKHYQNTFGKFKDETDARDRLPFFNLMLQMSQVLKDEEACVNIQPIGSDNTKAKVSFIYKNFKTADLYKNFTKLAGIISKMNNYGRKDKTYFDVEDITGYADQERILPIEPPGWSDSKWTGVWNAINGVEDHSSLPEFNAYQELLKNKVQGDGEESLENYFSDTHSNAYLALSRAASLKLALVKANAGDTVTNLNLEIYKNGMTSCRNFFLSTYGTKPGHAAMGKDLATGYYADTNKDEYLDDDYKGKLNNLIAVGDDERFYTCANRRKTILDGEILTFGESIAGTSSSGFVEFKANGPDHTPNLCAINPGAKGHIKQILARSGTYLFFEKESDKGYNIGLFENAFGAEVNSNYSLNLTNWRKELLLRESKSLATLLTNNNHINFYNNLYTLSLNPSNEITINKKKCSLRPGKPDIENTALCILQMASSQNLIINSNSTEKNVGNSLSYPTETALQIIQHGHEKESFRFIGSLNRYNGKTITSTETWTPVIDSYESKSWGNYNLSGKNWTLNDLLKSYIFKDTNCELYKKAYNAGNKSKTSNSQKYVFNRISLEEFNTLKPLTISEVNKVSMSANDCLAVSPRLSTEPLTFDCTSKSDGSSSAEGTETFGKNQLPHYGFVTTPSSNLINIDDKIISTLKTNFGSTGIEQANSILCSEKTDKTLGFLPTMDEQADCKKTP